LSLLPREQKKSAEAYSAVNVSGTITLRINTREYKCTIVPSNQKIIGMFEGKSDNETITIDNPIRPAYIIARGTVYNITRVHAHMPRLLLAGLGATGVYAAIGILQAIKSFVE
jgi:hypothetical protein